MMVQPDNDSTTVRKRVNTGFTASGKYTWEVTVEVVGDINDFALRNEQVMEQHDQLISAMQTRYGKKEEGL